MLSFASSRIQITAALIIATGMWLIPSCSSDAPTTSAAPEEKVDYYDTKAVKRRYQTVNGHKQGKMIEYYNDGKVKAERNFKNDLEDGRTVYYFPSGNVREVQHFVAGEKQMGDTLWYDTGELQFTVDFKDSKKNGYFRKWSKEGQTVIEAIYNQDTLVKVTKGLFHKGEAMEVDTVRKVYPATPESASGG